MRELEELAHTIREGGAWPISLGELVQATKTSFVVDSMASLQLSVESDRGNRGEADIDVVHPEAGS